MLVSQLLSANTLYCILWLCTSCKSITFIFNSSSNHNTLRAQRGFFCVQPPHRGEGSVWLCHSGNARNTHTHTKKRGECYSRNSDAVLLCQISSVLIWEIIKDLIARCTCSSHPSPKATRINTSTSFTHVFLCACALSCTKKEKHTHW